MSIYECSFAATARLQRGLGCSASTSSAIPRSGHASTRSSREESLCRATCRTGRGRGLTWLAAASSGAQNRAVRKAAGFTHPPAAVVMDPAKPKTLRGEPLHEDPELALLKSANQVRSQADSHAAGSRSDGQGTRASSRGGASPALTAGLSRWPATARDNTIADKTAERCLGPAGNGSPGQRPTLAPGPRDV